MGMIHCAGYNWSPALVGWGSAGPTPNQELLGYYPGKLKNHTPRGRPTAVEQASKTLNFWDVPGIYVLYRGDTVVYVGKSEDGGLGFRLKQHHQTDHLVGRWDTFSWVSPAASFEAFPGGDKKKPAALALGAAPDPIPIQALSAWLSEIEALLIQLARPYDNSQVPNLGNHVRWFEQLRSKHAVKTQEEMLRAIYDKTFPT
jgi:hypothetical protein